MRYFRVLALATMLLPGPLAAQGTAPPGFSPEQRAAIVDILREALRQDPSILREALMALEAAETRDREGAVRSAITAHAEALLRDPTDPVKGNPQGAVTIVEFFDARCGYCKQMHPVVEQLLRRQPDVRLVMKDLPILGPNSVLASRALLAAQAQGKYAALHEALMRLREEPAEPVLRREAERVGLDAGHGDRRGAGAGGGGSGDPGTAGRRGPRPTRRLITPLPAGAAAREAATLPTEPRHAAFPLPDLLDPIRRKRRAPCRLPDLRG
jgi:protein-disulfide isomerase